MSASDRKRPAAAARARAQARRADRSDRAGLRDAELEYSEEEHEAEADAIEMYRRFHRLEPTVLADFPGGDLPIPARAKRLGKAVHVLYRSSKVDPETLKRPRTPVNYIHEHDAGVHIYKPIDGRPIGPERSFLGGDKIVDVPREFVEAPGLVLLGDCLGLKFKQGVGEFELESDRHLPELYTIATGKLLVVVQDKREILYLVWGGALGVEGRGIVG